jgi:hypothetical protein
MFFKVCVQKSSEKRVFAKSLKLPHWERFITRKRGKYLYKNDTFKFTHFIIQKCF